MDLYALQQWLEWQFMEYNKSELIGVKMKYDIDRELKYFSLFSGSMVGHLYPLINAG